jgi:hypothetical protein
MSQIGFPAGLALVCLAVLVMPWARAATPGGQENPIEVILPFEMQASFHRSLPIAGHMVTPDQVATLVTTNPRLRVATGQPISGTGTAYPIDESNAADTHADLLQ